MAQFVINQHVNLRGGAITQQAYGLKYSELSRTPFRAGAKFDTGTTALPKSPAGGGEYWCEIPGITEGLVKVSPNKIVGSASAQKYTEAKAKAGNGTGKPHAAAPSDPATQYQVALRTIARLEKEIEEAKALLPELQQRAEDWVAAEKARLDEAMAQLGDMATETTEVEIVEDEAAAG